MSQYTNGQEVSTRDVSPKRRWPAEVFSNPLIKELVHKLKASVKTETLRERERECIMVLIYLILPFALHIRMIVRSYVKCPTRFYSPATHTQETDLFRFAIYIPEWPHEKLVDLLARAKRDPAVRLSSTVNRFIMLRQACSLRLHSNARFSLPNPFEWLTFIEACC